MQRALGLCLALVFVVGCVDQPPTSQSPGSPLASISDGATPGGNPHFWWKPPIGKEQVYTGVFNATLSPVLQICDGVVTATGECTILVATYTKTSGHGGKVIVVNTVAQQYQVDVDSKAIGLQVGKEYRWRVLVGGNELGHADVRVVASSKDVKKVQPGFIGLVGGGTLPTKFRIEQGALLFEATGDPCEVGQNCGEGTVTPTEGGLVTVQSSPGVDVAGTDIPPGAVTEETSIAIREVDCAGLPTGRKKAPPCYEFLANPEVADFNEPVLVAMCVDTDGLTPAEQERIALYKHDDGDPNVRELTHVAETFLECESAGLSAEGGNPLLRLASSAWRTVRRHLNPWFSPQPLLAVDQGRGGQIGTSDGGYSVIGWGVERVLIYGPSMSAPNPTGGEPENEQTLAAPTGLGAVVADATTWAAKAATGIDGFGDYDAIVFGDPSCSSDPGTVLATAEANKAVWSSVVAGPGIIIGTDPQEHQNEASPHGEQMKQLIQNGMLYASSGTRTGLYASLSCYYAFAADDPPTTVTFLSEIGTFEVIGQGGGFPTEATIVQPTHPAMNGLTSAGLSGFSAVAHDFFPTLGSFPADFVVLVTARRPGDDPPADLPYIIARPQPPPVIID